MIEPTPLTFAHPGWFWLSLVVAPLVVLRLLSRVGQRKALDAWVAQRLRQGLVREASAAFGWVVFSLQLIGILLMITALAQPLYGEKELVTEAEGRNVMLALDVSNSMLAEDVKPDRLARAKLACQDLIEGLFGERVGVIAFAGRAFLQAPLTVDHEAVLETVRQLDTSTIARGGTNLAEAISLSVETFRKSGAASNGLIIFSDGDELEGEALDAARKAVEENVRIITVGVGTEFGSIIPDPDAHQRGGEPFVKDERGHVVKSQLGVAVLQALAQAGGGFYVTLGSKGLPIERIAAVLEDLEAQVYEGSDRTVPIERYAWPLVLGMLLLLLAEILRLIHGQKSGFGSPGSDHFSGNQPAVGRPAGMAGLLLFALLSLPRPVAADDSVLGAYKAGDFESAKAGYEQRLAEGWRGFQEAKLQIGRGAAAYQLGDYEAAGEAFGEALKSNDRKLQADAHYNLGNTLAQQGVAIEAEVEKKKELWDAAVEHYESTLQLLPEHSDAAHNRGLVQRMLEDIPPPEEQESEKEEKKQEDQEHASDQEEQEEEQEGNEGDEEQKDQEQDQEQDESENSEEQEEKDGEDEPSDKENGEQEDASGEQKKEGDEQSPSSQDEGGDEEKKEQGNSGGQENQQPAEGSEGEKTPEGDLDALGGSSDEEEDGKEHAAAAGWHFRDR